MSQSGEVLAVVLEAVYACAADPDRWEDLIDIFVPLDDHLSEEGNLGEKSVRVEQTLLAHLDRAQSVARRLNVGETATVPSVFPPPVAYVIVGRDSRLLAATPSAAPLLASFSGALVTGRVFTLADPANQNRYRIARATLKNGAGTAPVLFNFDDGEATESLSGFLVDAAHLKRLLGDDVLPTDDPQAHALLLPDRTALTRHDHLLRASLGLTPAELRLAALLKDGASINEAAPKLGIAVNTARNHLRSIFAKLGVNRQSEMVRHLSELGQLAAFVRGAERREDDLSASDAEPSPHILTTRKFLTLADGRVLAFREYGLENGTPVLFLHALLSSSLLRDVENDYIVRAGARVIVAERPGTGRSTSDPDMSFESVARDLVALVDHLNINKLYVLGRSSGAGFALEAARALGSRVERLMLYAPRFSTDTDLRRHDPLGRFYAGMRRMPWYVDAVLALLRAKLSHRFVREIMRRSHERSPADYKLMESEPGLLEFMVVQSLEALEVTHAGATSEAALLANDAPVDLEGVEADVIVWHGQEDGYVMPADVERHISNLPVSEFRVIENEGHIFSLAGRSQVLERLLAG